MDVRGRSGILETSCASLLPIRSAQGVLRARYLHPTLVRVTKLSRSLAHPEWDLDETKLFISSHTMYLLTRAGLTSGRNYSVHRCMISHLQAQILPDGSKMFPVSLSQVVRDSVKHFKVLPPFFRSPTHVPLSCVFSPDHPLSHSNLFPQTGCNIQFNGPCSYVFPSGMLAVTVDTFCLGITLQPLLSIELLL